MKTTVRRCASLWRVSSLGAVVFFCAHPLSVAGVRRVLDGASLAVTRSGGGRGLARWASVVGSSQQPAGQAKPCGKEHRQLDFWVGEWDVTALGQKVATSNISLIEGGCIVLERYSQRDGYTGQSFNYYNHALGRWRQVWVDRGGNISEFSGEYKDGAMRYEGASYPLGQAKVLRRMFLFDLGRDEVRQLSYRSADDGRTWHVNYDFLYVRKK